MELSPKLYHYLVRPKWFAEMHIKYKLSHLLKDYDFNNKHIVDFGCGVGSNSIMFNDRYYIGLDKDKKRIEYAKKIYQNYQFKPVDTTTLPILTNSTDYILIAAVLHHIDNSIILEYIKEFKRILNTGGKIIVIEPCYFENMIISNSVMKFIDRGEYIRNRDEYFRFFKEDKWKIENAKRFKKCIIYNEVFFTAALR